MKQKTISKSFSLEGMGIHSGNPSKVIFSPADPDSGICFLDSSSAVKIRPSLAASTVRGTTLKIKDKTVAIVEHAMAAIFGLGIDNIKISLEGEEFPILDGSALPYAQGLIRTGIVEQAVDKKVICLDQEVMIKKANTILCARPYNGFRISFMVNFQGFGEQKLEIDIDPGTFLKEIVPARTFGYVSELEALKSKGLGLGASTENALALGDGKYLNAPRFKDELVRHKILDLIGDLALLGRPINAEITAKMSGHDSNVELAKKLEELYGA